VKANYPYNIAHGGVVILISVAISSLYSPPKHKVLNADLHHYFSNNFIVGGDYYAKYQSWGCRSNNPYGSVLYTYVSAKKLNVLVPLDPTYWPSFPCKKPDILDIFVTKIPSSLHSSTIDLLDLNSDHSSIFSYSIPSRLLTLIHLRFLILLPII